MASPVVAVSGASGLIGGALTAALRANGVTVLRLVRRPARAADEVSWDPARGEIDTATLADAQVTGFVHLAGAGVGDRRWTRAYKDEIRASRVLGTRTLARAAAMLPTRPVVVSGSAIGYYGDTGAAIVDETGPVGDTFLAGVVADWESAARPALDAGNRVAFARTGLVVTDRGGAWGRMVPLFKAGIGGPLGSGRQWWSFISLTDEVRALQFLLDHDIHGPVNLVAPAPIRNKDAATTLGRFLHRPAVLPVPTFALRTVLGEFGDEVAASQGVRPAVLAEHGFTWRHPQLAEAMAAELG